MGARELNRHDPAGGDETGDGEVKAANEHDQRLGQRGQAEQGGQNEHGLQRGAAVVAIDGGRAPEEDEDERQHLHERVARLPVARALQRSRGARGRFGRSLRRDRHRLGGRGVRHDHAATRLPMLR